ncbi:MAG: hypothetical protein V1717_00880 [Candidatus Micrarchaeota archaeon]
MIIAIAVFWVYQNQGAGIAGTQILPQGQPQVAQGTDANLKYLEQFPDLMRALEGYQAGRISVRPEDLPPQIFAQLPPFPTDFWPMKLLVEKGKITRMELVNDSYYKQPEFYSEWDTGCKAGIQHPPTNRFVGFGLAVYPSETVVLSPKTNEFDVYFFIRSSCLMTKYQGIRLTSVPISSASLQLNEYPDGTRSVEQDWETVNKYFEITATPNEFVLEPTFPVYRPEWVKKIKVHVKVKNAPSGKYVLGLDVIAPSVEKSNDWLWQYKTDYVEAGAHSLGYPWYKIFIEV